MILPASLCAFFVLAETKVGRGHTVIDMNSNSIAEPKGTQPRSSKCKNGFVKLPNLDPEASPLSVTGFFRKAVTPSHHEDGIVDKKACQALCQEKGEEECVHWDWLGGGLTNSKVSWHLEDLKLTGGGVCLLYKDHAVEAYDDHIWPFPGSATGARGCTFEDFVAIQMEPEEVVDPSLYHSDVSHMGIGHLLFGEKKNCAEVAGESRDYTFNNADIESLFLGPPHEELTIRMFDQPIEGHDTCTCGETECYEGTIGCHFNWNACVRVETCAACMEEVNDRRAMIPHPPQDENTEALHAVHDKCIAEFHQKQDTKCPTCRERMGHIRILDQSWFLEWIKTLYCGRKRSEKCLVFHCFAIFFTIVGATKLILTGV